MTPLAMFIFVILSVVPNAIGITVKCFDCRSDVEPKCVDPFDNSTVAITDCARVKGLSELVGVRPIVCRKTKQKVNGAWLYIRDCAADDFVGYQGDKQTCHTRPGPDNNSIEYCTCNNKDGCNSAYLFTSKPTVLVTLVIMPWLMFNLIM